MATMNGRYNSQRKDQKPVVEIDRWEGEGGNPPAHPQNPPSTVTGILRKLLIDWHLINSSSTKH